MPITARDCNPGIPNPWIPDGFSIPKSRDCAVCARPNPGISGLEFPVISYVEKHALLIKYKLYVNAVAELAGLKAASIPIENLFNGVPW